MNSLEVILINQRMLFTYKNLKSLIQDQHVIILQRDKDSIVIIMDKSDYAQKLEDIIEEGISKGTYERPQTPRLIFKGLLMKLAREIFFTFNNKFYKQIYGCTMGVPLSVTLSDIYIYIYI